MRLILSALVLLFASFAVAVPSIDPEAAIQAGLQFLSQHRDDVDFEVEATLLLADPIREVAEDGKLAPPLRSRAHLVLAGIHGKISDLLRSRGGISHGKLALQSLKESVRLDPHHADAAIAYATTIGRMVSKGSVTRRFIQMGMGISLAREAAAAMNALEQAGLKSHPLYAELEDFIG